MKTSSVIVNPIARPAIKRKAPLGSAAVAKITQTRKKVRIASITTPWPPLIPGPRAGTPRLTASTLGSGSRPLRSSAATIAPVIWANQ
jgi:hypothetical protein